MGDAMDAIDNASEHSSTPPTSDAGGFSDHGDGVRVCVCACVCVFFGRGGRESMKGKKYITCYIRKLVRLLGTISGCMHVCEFVYWLCAGVAVGDAMDAADDANEHSSTPPTSDAGGFSDHGDGVCACVCICFGRGGGGREGEYERKKNISPVTLGDW